MLDNRKSYELIIFTFLKEIILAVEISSKKNSKSVHLEIKKKMEDWLFSEIDFLTEAHSLSYNSELYEQQIDNAIIQNTKSTLRKSVLINFKEKIKKVLYFFGLLDVCFKIYIRLRNFIDNLVEKKIENNDISITEIFSLNDEQVRKVAKILVTFNEKKLEAIHKKIAFLDKKQSIIFVSHLFPSTWSPTVQSLRSLNFHTSWIGVNPVEYFGSYGVLTNKLVNTNEVITERLLNNIIYLSSLKNCKILLSGECYIGSNWKINDTTLLYMVMTAVTKTIRKTNDVDYKNLILIMYDGIKPFSDFDDNQSITYFYSSYLREANKIIFNSNTTEFGEFIFNSLNINVPKISFPRYGFANHKKTKKHNFNEIHIACITVVLSEFDEPSRNNVTNFVESICKSGIHFHYFCEPNSRVVKEFSNRLGIYSKYFHAEKIEKDPKKLVEKISKFHYGFNPSDHRPFSAGIYHLKDGFYQDALSMFMQSTIGTSFLVYASAGLPVILPRWCSGSINLLGENAIPLNLSELSNLKIILSRIDTEKLNKKCLDRSIQFDIDHNINKLVKFLND